MNGLTDREGDDIIAIERGCSAISLVGCVFVLVTFSFSDAFRQRAINRMVFYATFGNMLTNVATLMTRSYTHDVDSFGCQLQGFLIQVFLQGDAYWALAMAVNVWLTFYHKYDARMLRRMEIPYFLLCYGMPFIPGFTFLFVSTPDKGRPYGNAILWCWLRPSWEIYRIVLFYGPVWVAIVVTMAIYTRCGREIYMKRRKMLNFSSTGTGTGTGTVTGTVVGNDAFSPTANEFSSAFNYKTTEVVQTTEFIRAPLPIATANAISGPGPARDPNVSYSVTISADTNANNQRDSFEDDIEAQVESPTASTSTSSNIQNQKHNRATSTAINTTQISSSPNFHARRRNFETNNATWSYFKCAILFFSVLLITWIPSSANRVYSMIHGGAISKPLFFASAFVLPLQGFWNAIIYIVTSWAACKSFATTILLSLPPSCRSRTISIVEITDHGHKQSVHHTLRRDGMGRPSGGVGKWVGHHSSKNTKEETTSMEDLTREGRSNIDRVSPSPL